MQTHKSQMLANSYARSALVARRLLAELPIPIGAGEPAGRGGMEEFSCDLERAHSLLADEPISAERAQVLREAITCLLSAVCAIGLVMDLEDDGEVPHEWYYLAPGLALRQADELLVRAQRWS